MSTPAAPTFATLDPAGIPLLQSLATSIWAEAYRDLLSPAQIAYMLRMMYDEAVVRSELAAGVRWELIQVDGTAAGFLSWRHDAGWTKLAKIYLDQAWRGRGIVDAAIARVTADARTNASQGVWLTVNKANRRAQAAYTRLGFAISESVTADIGGGYVMDDFVMRRALPPG